MKSISKVILCILKCSRRCIISIGFFALWNLSFQWPFELTFHSKSDLNVKLVIYLTYLQKSLRNANLLWGWLIETFNVAAIVSCPGVGPSWVTAQVGGETHCGLACSCLIMSSQNTKYCEGEQCDHVSIRKLHFRVKMRIPLIDKCNKCTRICLGDKFLSVEKWEIAKL